MATFSELRPGTLVVGPPDAAGHTKSGTVQAGFDPAGTARLVRWEDGTSEMVEAKSLSIQTGPFFQVSIGPFEADASLTVFGSAVAGAILWHKHPILGLVAGGSVANNFYALQHPETKQQALANLGTSGLSVAGALLWEDHPLLGFLAGQLIGGYAAKRLVGKMPFLPVHKTGSFENLFAVLDGKRPADAASAAAPPSPQTEAQKVVKAVENLIHTDSWADLGL